MKKFQFFCKPENVEDAYYLYINEDNLPDKNVKIIGPLIIDAELRLRLIAKDEPYVYGVGGIKDPIRKGEHINLNDISEFEIIDINEIYQNIFYDESYIILKVKLLQVIREKDNPEKEDDANDKDDVENG